MSITDICFNLCLNASFSRHISKCITAHR
uniref:Uncharacterized protein n=1 Tax=Anguilla anguilla TaxID=7936 RepID=A0A0E9PGB0_ANGAN